MVHAAPLKRKRWRARLAALLVALVGLGACGYDPSPQDLEEDTRRRRLLRGDPAFAQLPAPGAALVGCDDRLPEFVEPSGVLDFGSTTDNEVFCRWRLTDGPPGFEPVRALVVSAIDAAEANGWELAGFGGWGWDEVGFVFAKNIDGVWARLSVRGDLREPEAVGRPFGAFLDGPLEIRYTMPAAGTAGYPPEPLVAANARPCLDVLPHIHRPARVGVHDGALYGPLAPAC